MSKHNLVHEVEEFVKKQFMPKENNELLETICCVLKDIVETQKQTNKILEKYMSALSDQLAGVQTNLASIAAGITALDDLIQKLQNSPGTLGPADQAALDAISTQSAALATAANSLPVPPGTPVVPVTEIKPPVPSGPS